MDENKELQVNETVTENEEIKANNDINNDIAIDSQERAEEPVCSNQQPQIEANEQNFAPIGYSAEPINRVDPPVQPEGKTFPPEYVPPQPMQMPVQPQMPYAPQPNNQVPPNFYGRYCPNPNQPVNQPVQPPKPPQPMNNGYTYQQSISPQGYNPAVPPNAPQPNVQNRQYQPYSNQPQPPYYHNQVNNQPYQPYNPYGYIENRGNGMAIAAMVCGICGIALWWGIFTGLVLGVLGVVFGFGCCNFPPCRPS